MNGKRLFLFIEKQHIVNVIIDELDKCFKKDLKSEMLVYYLNYLTDGKYR